MVSSGIFSSVKSTMADVFDIDDTGITLDTSAKDIEEWDSLSHIRLIVAVERKFKIKFKNSEIESLQRVGDLAALIETKTA
jgi:acyl carrier protein